MIHCSQEAYSFCNSHRKLRQTQQIPHCMWKGPEILEGNPQRKGQVMMQISHEPGQLHIPSAAQTVGLRTLHKHQLGMGCCGYLEEGRDTSLAIGILSSGHSPTWNGSGACLSQTNSSEDQFLSLQTHFTKDWGREVFVKTQRHYYTFDHCHLDKETNQRWPIHQVIGEG